VKIHVVQKGDTLWNLSKKYNVDFEELKAANSQLANPDMVMPGMKIKIPIKKKHVPKQGMAPTPDEKIMTPFKHKPQKAQPVIKEDDHKPKKKVQKKIPYPKLPPVSIQMPKLPNIHANQYNVDVGIDFDDHDTTLNNKIIHQHHEHQQPVYEKETVEKKHVPVEHPKKEMPEVTPLPLPLPQYGCMWMPMMPCSMPCSMSFYPTQQYYPTHHNMCQLYQTQPIYPATDPCKQSHHHTHEQKENAHSPKWGELDDKDISSNDITGMSQNNMHQMQHPYNQVQTTWPYQQYS